MKDLVTLVIILHNRHSNLDRLLKYYNNFTSPIVVADSSIHEHDFSTKPGNVTYLYTPELSYTQKIAFFLEKITTPYVAMCADDDFIIPKGLYQNVQFLQEHGAYTVAQGQILKYYPYSVSPNVSFEFLYHGDHSLEMDDAGERVRKLFRPYKSLLYAVHRTSVLKIFFRDAGPKIKNLYLNEYMTSIAPVLLGKSKDLNTLYQVREFSEASDDKITNNLDVLLNDNSSKFEIDNFLDILVANSFFTTDADKEILREKINDTLTEYSFALWSFKKTEIPVRKRVGRIISLIPVIGKKIVQRNREMVRSKILHQHLREEDINELKKIEEILV
jgi:glycosyltransferase domain-containing protein